MLFEEAKAALREGYQSRKIEVREEERELYVTIWDDELCVTEEDIATYAEMASEIDSFEIEPTGCGFYGTNYREHLLTSHDRIRGRYLPFNRPPFVFGETSDSETYVEIGSASDKFVNMFRFHDVYFEISLKRFRRPGPRHRREDKYTEGDIRAEMFRPTTICVQNIAADSLQEAVRKTDAIIEACLFELAYFKGIALVLAEGWPARDYRRKRFIYGELIRGRNFPFPKVRPNSDILRFYQRAMSTDDPVLQFLSFYQILEYFFLRVTEQQLYSRLSRRINDPGFSTNPHLLDRVIQDVLDHERTTDETKMLKAVLEEFVNDDQLIDFIEAYEEYLGYSHYTKKRSIFGQALPEVRFTPGHLFGNIAKNVKVVRNAIVHSSDRYERLERFVPLTVDSEKIISQEIPLLKFLAERVAVASGPN